MILGILHPCLCHYCFLQMIFFIINSCCTWCATPIPACRWQHFHPSICSAVLPLLFVQQSACHTFVTYYMQRVQYFFYETQHMYNTIVLPDYFSLSIVNVLYFIKKYSTGKKNTICDGLRPITQEKAGRGIESIKN